MKKRLQMSFKELLKDQTREFKLYYFFAVIFLYFTHRIQSELPFLAKELADLVTSHTPHYNVSKFFWFAIGIVIFRTSSRVLFFYPARILQKFLREEILDKLQNASPFRYGQLNSGQLFQYLTGDVDQIRALIGFVGLQGGNFVIGLFVLVPKMVAFNSQLLWALIPMILSFFIFTFIVSKNREFFKLTQQMQGEVQNLIIESYQGKKTIKNFNAEKPFIHLFEEMSLKELYYFYRSSLGISVTLPLIAFGIGCSMLWGAYIIKMQNLGAGTLILFSGFIFLFMEPMGYLSWIGVVVSRSYASWKRLQELNDVLSTPSAEEIKIKSENADKKFLEFHFSYWDKSLDLEFTPKTWNALVSKTGHGKTVLLSKLAEVLASKNVSMSLVFQDPYIYNDTILNNIFLGRDITEEMKIDAKLILKLMGLDYLEKDLDKLLDLEVGENGKRLSGGQAKRLCLIRSILSDAEVLLWDDPFSSVDMILEKEIVNLLKEKDTLKNKTVILTSHRLSTIKNCQFVYLIDKDQGIVEKGEVENLLNKKMEIYEYFKSQMV